MDDLQHGTRNKRGDWAPTQPLTLAPLWSWPPQLARIPGWLLGYLWPWNLFSALTALACWTWVLPDLAAMQSLSWRWIVPLLAVNLLGIGLFYGAFEWRYYRQRVQSQRFKYNGRFPAEQPSDVFLFKSQNLDNALRSLLVSVPIGTAIEVGLLWGCANGAIPSLSWHTEALSIVLVALAAPVVHEVHFYAIHRAIHWGPLYRWVHAVHHNSVNPSPWSSLSMHPVEAAAYFGVALWMLVLPSHPFLAVLFFHLAGYGAVVGHIGFDRLELGSTHAPHSSAYAHYLHHKYFDVNYCDNGVFPLDQWFGSWHDGSAEGERQMQERFRKRRERLNTSS
jgi:sterol desaturase/sphingolipid hydroxylase (fatty acid hydroxylase superfamily)